MGKGTVDEKSPQYGGTYAGIGSKDDVKDVVESSDLVLWIGMYPVSYPDSQGINELTDMSLLVGHEHVSNLVLIRDLLP
jgi:TPP-dependent 2-oxoacid decarboxylase